MTDRAAAGPTPRGEGIETYVDMRALLDSRHTFGTMMESINTRPWLETNRLILRVPALDDLDRWAEMMADENAARFIAVLRRRPSSGA